MNDSYVAEVRVKSVYFNSSLIRALASLIDFFIDNRKREDSVKRIVPEMQINCHLSKPAIKQLLLRRVSCVIVSLSLR